MDRTAERRDRLAKSQLAEGIDTVLITNPVNVTYLTGFSGESSYLVMHRERALLVSDSRFQVQLQEECPEIEVILRPASQPIGQATGEVLSKLGTSSVGFESSHLSVAEWESLREAAPALSWKPGRERVESLRAIKDPSEVVQIREAIHIAERAFEAFRALLRPSDTERDLCNTLDAFQRRLGAQGSSFPSIVAMGARSALPHAPPTDQRLADARLVLVDWGAAGRFYKSDLTRILVARTTSAFIRPPHSEADAARLAQIHAIVREAQEAALRQLAPGARAGDIDAAARAVIANAGYGDYFGHSLGHGLGMQVHEAPFLRPKVETRLQAGNVVTVEPGIYLPGWGGVRLEDDVLITPDGSEVLSSLPRDLPALTADW